MQVRSPRGPCEKKENKKQLFPFGSRLQTSAAYEVGGGTILSSAKAGGGSWLAAWSPGTRRSGLGFSGVSGLCREQAGLVCIGCWRALSDVRWIERIEHADHIIFYIQYFPVKSWLVWFLHTRRTYIPPRDIIFGSDGDWGGIYISRALFSPIPVDNDANNTLSIRAL